MYKYRFFSRVRMGPCVTVVEEVLSENIQLSFLKDKRPMFLAWHLSFRKKSSSFTGRLRRRHLRPKHLEDINDAKTLSNTGSGKSLGELTRLCKRRTTRVTWDKRRLPKDKRGETKEKKNWKRNNTGDTGKVLYRCVVGANHSKKFVQQITALFDCPGDSADRQSVGIVFVFF